MSCVNAPAACFGAALHDSTNNIDVSTDELRSFTEPLLDCLNKDTQKHYGVTDLGWMDYVGPDG